MPVAHGGALSEAITTYGGDRADWLDLSTGINPTAYPVPPISPEAWQRLPDEDLVRRCEDAARAYYHVPDGAFLVATPGTQAAIQCLDRILPEGPVEIVEPCYGEYRHVLVHRAVAAGSAPRGKAVVFGHPNNPDGKTHDLDGFFESYEVLVADEAFFDAAPDDELQSFVRYTASNNVLVLKSFGKFFGLAGLRLGFAIGSEETVGKIRELIGPWAVPGPALEVGTMALADKRWICETRARLRNQREALQAVLLNHGFERVGHTDLFATVHRHDAIGVCEHLARHKILVRSFDYQPSWLRFGLPTDQKELARLDAALTLL
ncbi:MAG: threonine-phosphate decarboxylase [Pseudomonadota bacterium]